MAADLVKQGKGARTVTLKLRFPPFETLSRSITRTDPSDLADVLFEAAAGLFERAWAENDRRPVRLLGMGAANLQPVVRQLRLGETLEMDRLAETVTDIRERFGDAAVLRAAEIDRPPPR